MSDIDEEESDEYISDYKIGKLLGEGAFGKVKLGQNKRNSDDLVAIKTVKKSNLKNEWQSNGITREINLMKTLRHPNIIRVFNVQETDEDLNIIMEYASGGELYDLMLTNGSFNEQTARNYFRQILSAVSYCHKNFITHRDLKPENLLLDSKDNIKIIDFGFSNFYERGSLMDTFCGSPCYWPPEMITSTKYEGEKVDIWGLGIILYSFLTGKSPFEGETLQELYENISKGRYSVPQYVSQSARSLIASMLVVNFNQRATLEQIINHKWVNEGYSSIVDDHLPVREIVNNPDESILNMVKNHHPTLSKEQIQEQIKENKSGPVLATYHLIAESIRSNQKNLVEYTMQRSRSDSLPESVGQLGKFESGTKRSPSLDAMSSIDSRTRKHSFTEALSKMMNKQNPRITHMTMNKDHTQKETKVFALHYLSSQNKGELTERIFEIFTTKGMKSFKIEKGGFIRVSFKDTLVLAVEVTDVPKMSKRGVRFKRIKGDVFVYKKIIEQTIEELKLVE